MTSQAYDSLIIGAGMSGLAAGIRLAMFGQKVCIVESHSIAGGLNSYYQRRHPETKETFLFDVGLHALTNFVPKGTKRAPLTKLLKQLRIPYDAFKLREQSFSFIDFPHQNLRFSNDRTLLEKEIASKFPQERQAYQQFVAYIQEFDEVNLSNVYQSSREVLNDYFSDATLKEMLLAPLLIYGSAWENDMDFSQFVIMFKAIYLEGFSRPQGGVRTIITALMQKFQEVGGEILFRHHVEKISQNDQNLFELMIKGKATLVSKKIFSSIGLPETLSLTEYSPKEIPPRVGQMSFVETIFILKNKMAPKEFGATISFRNLRDTYHYEKPQDLVDYGSAVVCFPDNFEPEMNQNHGIIRLTFMANYDRWKSLSRKDYKEEKLVVENGAKKFLEEMMPNVFKREDIIFSDVFTPLTIERYTKHFNGTVYGCLDKSRDGKTSLDGLYIIGTDQGFLGIVGAILSGISIANLYGLMEE